MQGAGAAVVGATALAGAARAEAPHILTSPLALYHDVPLIGVVIDGKGPFRFAIASGDSVLPGINADLAKSLNLEGWGGVRVETLGHAGARNLVFGRNVVIGRHFSQERMRFAVAHTIGYDGVLPSQFLLDRPCELDFGALELRMYAEGRPDTAALTPIPLLWQYQHRAVIEVKVDGIPARVELSTGGGRGLSLYPRFLRGHGLWDRYPRSIDLDEYESDSDTVYTRSKVVKAQSLEIGGFKFRDPVVVLTDTNSRYQSDVDGVIGVDLLRRFCLVFDAGAHTLWLKRTAAIADPFRYDRAGAVVVYHPKTGDGSVRSVAAGSPAAEAGLQAGDRLPGVTSLEALSALVWRLTGDAGTVVPVDVLRAGAPMTFRITLAERL